MHLSKISDWYVLVGLPPRHLVHAGEREEVNLKETNFAFSLFYISCMVYTLDLHYLVIIHV